MQGPSDTLTHQVPCPEQKPWGWEDPAAHNPSVLKLGRRGPGFWFEEPGGYPHLLEPVRTGQGQ